MSNRRKLHRTVNTVLAVDPADRPLAGPDAAKDPDAERWWILDPDGHREVQGRMIGLPPGVQAAPLVVVETF